MRSSYRPSAPREERGEALYVRPSSGQEADSHLYVEMKPDKFLKLAVGGTEVFKSWQTSESCRVLADKIRQQLPADIPHLWVRSTDCQVLAHEGRHRASAAKGCHVKVLPVLFHCRDENLKPTSWENCFKCQKKKRRLKRQASWDTQDVAYRYRNYGDKPALLRGKS